jgi:hypothetical protein
VAINAVMALIGRVVLGFVVDRLQPRRSLGALLPGAGQRHRRARAPGAGRGLRRLRRLRLVGNNITLSPLIVQREYTTFEVPPSSPCRPPWCRSLPSVGLLGILRDAFSGYGVRSPSARR